MDWEAESRALNGSQRGRKNIRNIKELENLKVDTRIADKNERERILRLEKIEKKFKDAFIGNELEGELILDYDFVKNVPLVSVNKVLVQKLKAHQKDGVRFMWNSCYESIEQTKISDGSGCILAHCMGLGKTFQVITLVHTLLNHPEVGTKRILIFCPKNTLMNWMNEFHMWISPDLGFIHVYNPTSLLDHSERLKEIFKWHTNGGVCVMNYELFRNLLDDDKEVQRVQSKTQITIQEYLCNPGPDLVICDEGHVLKNEDTKLSKIMSRIRTMRRIVLTGTPLQNNLKEYHCMIQFVKPNLLGTRNEFTNMFVNPILNGQYENSLEEDVQLMKERSHILHKKLKGVVQRFDLTTLKTFLPEKQEYAVFVPLTEIQTKLYRFYLDNYSAKKDFQWQDSVKLLADYQSFQRIWTHPYTLKSYADNYENAADVRKRKSKRKKENNHNSGDESSADEEAFQKTRYPLNFWVQFATSDDIQDPRHSNKLVLLLKVLKECEDASEKLLVFSVSVYSLRTIEYFLKKINDSDCDDDSVGSLTPSWVEGEDYLVLTGDTSSADRDRFCKLFNDTSNTRLRLFLISTKAGGIGINLTAANRAILFDVSWNPSHDIQSIFRIYRIGQKKPCFVYRFVSSGTLEEKIYERQVTKQSVSYRVIDEKQIARHYTDQELLGLYQFEPNKKHKNGVKPKDPVLQKILVTEEAKLVVGLHEHDSLLEHKEEEELQEIEKTYAWTAYRNDNDVETISAAEKTMLSELTPESFNPLYLRMVLEKKFGKATDEEITQMMAQLMPRVYEILQRRDFIDIMKREAVLSKARQAKSQARQEETSPAGMKGDDGRSWLKRKKMRIIDLTEDSPLKKGNLSGSDDSLFLYNIGEKKKKKKKKKQQQQQQRLKPLKVWGVRNGKRYGSPDSDIDLT